MSGKVVSFPELRQPVARIIPISSEAATVIILPVIRKERLPQPKPKKAGAKPRLVASTPEQT
jgi:hypothetical protein